MSQNLQQTLAFFGILIWTAVIVTISAMWIIEKVEQRIIKERNVVIMELLRLLGKEKEKEKEQP